MMISNLNNIGTEFNLFPEAIKRAIAYIKQTDFSSLKIKQKYFISGEDIFAQADEYATKPRREKKAEQHRKYIDLHYVISGTESFGACFENSGNEIIEDYVLEKDRLLYRKIINENYFTLRAGDFVIFFPTDIHRPGCFIEQASLVKKIIIKIAVDLLNN